MNRTLPYDPDIEWLDHVRPVGLVVAPNLLKELGLVPELQTRRDNDEVLELLATDVEAPALPDPWAFMERILGWPVVLVAGAPGGPALPEELAVRLPEYDTTLEPHWAIKRAGNQEGWQALVRIEPRGIDPDARGALKGWEATPQQRFERLLRETGIETGILISDRELRLVYAPKGETSGWLAFPLRPLATVAGRPMLGGLKLVLGAFRLFNDAESRRLPALLHRSREAQAQVSAALSEQVLGALHELLRGLMAAEPDLIGELARTRPGHLYEGLLTVLLRLVFVLYAEDRDLLPSRTDAAARDFYDQGYAARALHAKLLEDAARHPDTMEERLGAWGRLLALFKLVHGGDGSGWIKGRGGKLFDPDAFPFLEGRREKAEAARVPKVTDACVLRLLDGLLTLKGERLSYRTLDVEQIGSVYETVMGFTVEHAAGPVLAIKAGKNHRVPVFVDLQFLLTTKPANRIKELRIATELGKPSDKVSKAINDAKSIDEVVAALDSLIDERASPQRQPFPAGTPILQPTDERRRTGSHYTPRSLTEPIVRHALEPIFARLGPDARPDDVLDLKACDPAMGSGAFLVEACRALAFRLVQAWARWPETRPTIPHDEDEDLHARRLVAQRCLYGVDRNPMAVDLARLSLWLATLARDHEFTFLDHALKAGDSLVGLSRAQIVALHWDEAKAGMPLFRQVVTDRVKAAVEGRQEIRQAPDNVSRAIQEVRFRTVEERLDHVRLIGDAVVAAFFSEKKAKAREQKRQEIESAANGPADLMWPKLEQLRATLAQGEHPVTPFHWEIEFPEVFARDNPGFDAMVGNPPFAGKNTVIAGNRKGYPDWLKQAHAGAHGNADLVAHFFRRAFGLIRQGGIFGLIATNTIRQGDTRQTGLTWIVQNGGAILRAVRRLKWPGEAAVVVSVVHIVRGIATSPVIDGKPVSRISAYLVDNDQDDSPARLVANEGKAFIGSYVLGMGFTFDDVAAAKGESSSRADMQRLIAENPRNAERIFPYIGGEEVNKSPRHDFHRHVINFDAMDEEVAQNGWPELMDIVREKVRPSRLKDNRAGYKRYWWRFAERRGGLQAALMRVPSVFVLSRVSPQLGVASLRANMVFAESLVVFAFQEMQVFSFLQSRPHEIWARFFSSSMKDDLRYAPSDCFETFPFPEGFEADADLEAAGRAYHDFRAQLMIDRNEGLTKTYNRFHKVRETAEDIRRLRELHHAMDQAVLRAYGWDDLLDRAQPIFLDESNEDDFTYQGRYFWPAEVRDDVLTRLLKLNAERAAAEKAQGLAPKAVEPDEDGDEATEEEDAEA